MFHSPLYLVLLLLLPLLAWRLFRPEQGHSIGLSSTALAGKLKPSLRQRLLWLPKVLTLLALLFLILGLARPREGREQTISEGEGIAIQFVVDKSGSMRAMDFKINGQQVDRLTAIKDVVRDFVIGGKEGLEGRVNDLTGLITFARYADSETPLTLDHNYFMTQLNQAEIVNERSESGTAIGDALALAVEKLNAMETDRADVKSRIVILLTDGENNIGQLAPVQAAELAKTLGIRVYTIGVGSDGQIPVPMMDPRSGREIFRWAEVSIDEETLKEVASMTGGQYFRATDTDSLENIYEEIDKLEKTTVQSKHFVDYRELAVQKTYWFGFRMPAVLFCAYVLLAIRVVLEMTWLRFGI